MAQNLLQYNLRLGKSKFRGALLMSTSINIRSHHVDITKPIKEYVEKINNETRNK